jgi:hypothetical protein
MRNLLRAAFFGAACLGPYLHSASGEIIFTNTQVDEQGTGFGNVLTVLSLQATPSEFGSVLWDGVSDVLIGDYTNQSQTRTVTELSAAGIDDSNFVVIFNINEGGDSNPVLTLHDFDIVFQDASGAELFRESFDASGGLPLDLAGSGNGASGWLFSVNFTTNAAAAAAFFNVATNRIGMEITSGQAIANTKGGADSFFVAAHVPEPATFLSSLVGAGTLALVSIRRRRTRRSRS